MRSILIIFHNQICTAEYKKKCGKLDSELMYSAVATRRNGYASYVHVGGSFISQIRLPITNWT